MFYHKHNFYFLSVIFAAMLFSQVFGEKEPRTLLFGLIKFDKESPYESGYWFDKWFRSREFASPVIFIPIELRYGIGFNGSFSGGISNPSAKDEKGNINYEDNTIEQLDQGFTNIWGSAIDLDLGLINIPRYLIKTSWMNMMTGINYRRSKIFSPAFVPYSVWGNSNASWVEKKKFSPLMNEFLITNTLQWQPFNFWYLNFRYAYGYATAKFYTSDNEIWDDTPTGSGTSMALGVGIRFILDPGKSNRFTLGLDIRHSYTKINNINDPANLTPISNFDLANYGLYLTISAFYGGKRTIGDEAKRLYYHKDYIAARNEFNQFIREYPSHANRRRALKYLEICEWKIPYVIMAEGIVLDDKGKTNLALNKYLKAKSLVKNDTTIMLALNGRMDQIALDWMNQAEILLPAERYDEAISIVRSVAKFSDHGIKALRRFKSYTILGNGKELQKAGFIGKAMIKYAEALNMNQELLFLVKALQYQAGIQMVNLAAEVDEFDEITLAIESLKYAKELSGEIGKKNENLLLELQNKLDSYNEFKMNSRIDERMNLARKKQAYARSEHLKLGMTLPQIQKLMGEPHEKIVGENKIDPHEQLWIYFINNKTLQLSFQNYILFKIEEI
tara:strand:- start:16776 stop:18626 length:1851 start_codon:yes stop_codon:yes gene_type:complete